MMEASEALACALPGIPEEDTQKGLYCTLFFMVLQARSRFGCFWAPREGSAVDLSQKGALPCASSLGIFRLSLE